MGPGGSAVGIALGPYATEFRKSYYRDSYRMLLINTRTQLLIKAMQQTDTIAQNTLVGVPA